MERDDIQVWGRTHVGPGQRKTVHMEVSESYTGLSVRLPMMVWRGVDTGPTLLVTAAVHGDEINGTGTIRELIWQPGFELVRGTLVMIPVINIVGFERHSRYMPDRRDLNRAFPGLPRGSITARLANLLFESVIRRCSHCIDLHTASVRRTNYPNVRGDMSNSGCKELAHAFGCNVIVNQPGPEGSLRRCATEAGVPAIIFEAGEVWKVERTYLETATRGIRNCLVHLKMIEGELEQPMSPTVVEGTRWVRVDAGGFLQFHVSPGDFVASGQPLATNTGLLGREQGQVLAPCDGLVIGMSTMPAVSPGDAVLQLAIPGAQVLRSMERRINRLEDDSLENRVREDLATSVHVVDAEVKP